MHKKTFIKPFNSQFKGPHTQSNQDPIPEQHSKSQVQSSDLKKFHSEINDFCISFEETTAKCTQELITELNKKQTKDLSDVFQDISNKNSDINNNKKKSCESCTQELQKLYKSIEKIGIFQRDASLSFSKSISTLAQVLKNIANPSSQRISNSTQSLKDLASPQKKRRISISPNPSKKLKK